MVASVSCLEIVETSTRGSTPPQACRLCGFVVEHAAAAWSDFDLEIDAAVTQLAYRVLRR